MGGGRSNRDRDKPVVHTVRREAYRKFDLYPLRFARREEANVPEFIEIARFMFRRDGA